METLDPLEFDVEAEELGQVLRDAEATLSASAGSTEARADAIIRLVQELKDAQRRFPDGRELRPLLYQAQEEASALRDRLWTDGQRLMKGRAIGMTLDRRCKRMDESVRLLEKAAGLDPTENPMLRADLDKARRRLNYLQQAQARAKAGQGKRWRTYAIIGAALIGLLLLLYFVPQLVPRPSLIGRATPTSWITPTHSISPSSTPAEAAPLAPADTAAPTPTLVATGADASTGMATGVTTSTAAFTATSPATSAATTEAATPRDTATPSPTFTGAPTRTPSPTRTPTATYTPTATPSPQPTDTPTARPRPLTPTPARSPSRAATPTPRPVYPAPILVQPEDIVYLSQGADSRYVMQWLWEGTLRRDEWFDVRIWEAGMPHYGVAWTKQPQYVYDICLKRNGLFYWSIAVIRGTDGQWQADLSPEASPRQFSSSRSDEWCAEHGRYTLPVFH